MEQMKSQLALGAYDPLSEEGKILPLDYENEVNKHQLSDQLKTYKQTELLLKQEIL